MELMNFVTLLMIVAVINAVPMDGQRRDDVPTDVGPPDPDTTALPGPTSTDGANQPEGTIAVTCSPTDASHVCELTTESGSPFPYKYCI